ncbi:MAG TPA: Uma2 family endonuclease [Lacipirellulaceae bacterium]
MAGIPQHPTFTSEPEPAWDVALLFPSQGDWSEGDFLALDTNHLVELVDGSLEVLPMPTTTHQLIAAFLHHLLTQFVSAGKLGVVFFAPLPIKIRGKTMREPDILFVARQHQPKSNDTFLAIADLVMEVVSPGAEARDRDYNQKRADYAALGINEYWIVDPQIQRITILSLHGGQYRVDGEFEVTQSAVSTLLHGFTVDVSAVFAAANVLN